MKLILASTSRYRHALIQHILPSDAWTAKSPSFEERDVDHLFSPSDPAAHAKRLAAGKAQSVASNHLGSWVLGCDEIIVLDGEMLHKPGTVDAAVEQLMSMSGKRIHVITGFCLGMQTAKEFLANSYAEESFVQVQVLDREKVRQYSETCKPLDCVGSFRLSDAFSKEIFEWGEGWTEDPTNLQGFPILAIRERLQEVGFEVLTAPDTSSWYR